METTTAPRARTHNPAACAQRMLAVRDALDILSGKWKISIISSLTFGKKRFKELQRDVEGITGKMLSKELKELEVNELVVRRVLPTQPVSVEYELTDYGFSLEKVIQELATWGHQHRQRIMGNGDTEA
ncbi:DNA-binding transcriptional regulator, HxlR family [Catalinimonas alkaloidigena]|uniref:DNA-binding transcriptional regulator, HxlR family n=1 Tax=Catalinimonas alkaloidigena TaxID=1075417 RepID=A0A1G8XNV9_9BACT|nr:helix-turn-helix domain-containing protein [Catalinimonas alkaloidigena]SDJ91834.1 DNA-binding transcriptional regulator, HxlR family [Catalinimonas alkaloidigena]